MRDFFHGVGKILTGPEGPAHDAIDNARDGTQEEDDSHDGLHHRGLEAGNVASRVTEEGIFRDQGSKKTHQQEDEHARSHGKGTVFLGRDGFHGVFGSIDIRVKGAGLAAPRFGDMFRHPPANKDDGEGGGKGKEIIAQDVHFIRRVNELSRIWVKPE